MTEPDTSAPVVQFVLELPSAWKPFVSGNYTAVATALLAGLGSVFGVPIGTPCRLTLDYTDRLQLMEVNGPVSKAALPLEVQGALTATFAILSAQIGMQTVISNIRTNEGQA